LGDEVLEAPNVGALGAEFYFFLTILHQIDRFLRFIKGTFKGIHFLWFPPGTVAIDSIQELPYLGRRVAPENVDRQVGIFCIFDLLGLAAVVVFRGDKQVSSAEVFGYVHV
jgi:hypothetical protein